MVTSLLIIKGMLGFYVAVEGEAHPESDGTDHRADRPGIGGETRLTTGDPDPAADILDLPSGGGDTPALLREGVRFAAGMKQ